MSIDDNNGEGSQPQWPPLSPVATGGRGLCPRCGRGHIFRGFLTVREQCEICGLNYGFADPADGPAVFVQLFACVPGVIFIVMLEILASPPLWAHILIGIPVLILTTILPLRPIKGWLIASQYVHKAQEAGTGKLWAQMENVQSDRPDDR